MEKETKRNNGKIVSKKNTKSLTKETLREKNKKFPKSSIQSVFRNILPNIIHQIFCFIQKQKRSGQIVQNFLSSTFIEADKKFDLNRFYNYQRLIKDKTNHYINIKGLKELNKFQEP